MSTALLSALFSVLVLNTMESISIRQIAFKCLNDSSMVSLISGPQITEISCLLCGAQPSLSVAMSLLLQSAEYLWFPGVY